MSRTWNTVESGKIKSSDKRYHGSYETFPELREIIIDKRNMKGFLRCGSTIVNNEITQSLKNSLKLIKIQQPLMASQLCQTD